MTTIDIYCIFKGKSWLNLFECRNEHGPFCLGRSPRMDRAQHQKVQPSASIKFLSVAEGQCSGGNPLSGVPKPLGNLARFELSRCGNLKRILKRLHLQRRRSAIVFSLDDSTSKNGLGGLFGFLDGKPHSLTGPRSGGAQNA